MAKSRFSHFSIPWVYMKREELIDSWLGILTPSLERATVLLDPDTIDNIQFNQSVQHPGSPDADPQAKHPPGLSGHDFHWTGKGLFQNKFSKIFRRGLGFEDTDFASGMILPAEKK
jgi:hypothetical protein